jgi:hypothetical protein
MLSIRDACRSPFATITIVMVANGLRHHYNTSVRLSRINSLQRCCQGMMITNHSCTAKEAALPSRLPVVLLCRQGTKDLNQLL